MCSVKHALGGSTEHVSEAVTILAMVQRKQLMISCLAQEPFNYDLSTL